MKKFLIILAIATMHNTFCSDKPRNLRQTFATKLSQVNQRRANRIRVPRVTNFDEAFNAAYAQLMQARTVRDITPADLGIEQDGQVNSKLKYEQRPHSKQHQKTHHRYHSYSTPE